MKNFFIVIDFPNNSQKNNCRMTFMSGGCFFLRFFSLLTVIAGFQNKYFQLSNKEKMKNLLQFICIIVKFQSQDTQTN
jgi:hypothetical protein